MFHEILLYDFLEIFFIIFIYYCCVDMCVGLYWYLSVHVVLGQFSGVSPEVFLYVQASIHDCFKCLFPLAKFPNIDVCTKGEHFRDFWDI